jgi:arylsulfatase A-like enzyme
MNAFVFGRVLVVFWISAMAGAWAERLPNIVYVICDDLGYGDIQGLNPGRGKIPTPNVDRLISEGMVFTDAHSGSSVCTPTRYGVITGRYAWRTHLQRGVLTHDAALIANERMTVAELLKQAGYTTGAIGKWHLGITYTDANGTPIKVSGSKKRYGAPVGSIAIGGPVDHGFDYYYGFSYARSMRSIIENDRVIADLELDRNLAEMGSAAERYIEAHAKKKGPFFLYIALGAPHTPIVPSAEWIGKSGMSEYCDFVMETDHTAGRIFSALEKNGIADDTLVIFTSDNGCSKGPAKAAQLIENHGHYPSAHLRGYKSDGWDGGHRVPFVVRWPARVKPGTVNGQLICLTSLMATCAELTRQELPAEAGEDSESILPLLLDKKEQGQDAVIHHSIAGRFAIRKGRWKLCVFPGSGGWSEKDGSALKAGKPELQLYDMETDLGEQTNLAEQRPEKVQELLALLEEQVEKGRSTPGAAQGNDVPVDIYKKK